MVTKNPSEWLWLILPGFVIWLLGIMTTIVVGNVMWCRVSPGVGSGGPGAGRRSCAGARGPMIMPRSLPIADTRSIFNRSTIHSICMLYLYCQVFRNQPWVRTCVASADDCVTTCLRLRKYYIALYLLICLETSEYNIHCYVAYWLVFDAYVM